MSLTCDPEGSVGAYIHKQAPPSPGQTTASAAVRLLEELDIVAELTGQKKNRVYSYRADVELPSR